MKLNLLAVSYKNIGPFKDQLLSLVFEKGNYLIKAPIGTGKSFLFFDGPTYALYKTSTRNILNIQSEKGFVKLLFQVNTDTYLIIRELKQGKSRDSTSSHIFKCEIDEPDFFKRVGIGNPLRYGVDIEKILKEEKIPLEEIEFKNETDLQQLLNSFLPPQEVFVSTIFLLQDSANIFEMQPAERLEVLKNVFGLLGIDESKELVKDKRNEIKFQIKAYQDTSNYEEKLKNYLSTIIEGYYTLADNALSKDLVQDIKQQIEERDGFKDKLSINNFTIDESLLSIKAPIEEKLQENQEIYQKKRATLNAYQEQSSNLKFQLTDIEKTQKEKQLSLDLILKKLSEINEEELKGLKQEKVTLQSTQEYLESQGRSEYFEKFYSENRERFSFQERTTFSLRMNQQFIQELIALGTSLKSKNDFFDKQLEHLKKQYLLAKETFQSQIKTLEEKKSFYENQQKSLEEKIKRFEKQVNEEESFTCGEISGQCPFIRVINKQHFEEREKEKTSLLKEKQELEELIKKEAFDEKLAELKTKLQAPQDFQEEKKLEDEKKENQTNIEIIKHFLQSFDYKQINDLCAKLDETEKNIKVLEKQIQEKEELVAHQEKYQQEKIQIETTITQLQEQQKSLDLQQQEVAKKISGIQEELQKEPKEEMREVTAALENYDKSLQFLKEVIEDYLKKQTQLKALEEEEKRLNVLYGILNKELLLFVLGEYLPTLTDIINSYLVTVVDYQISIKLKENSEKLELETKVIDNKGEREIKSLSGGQKTVLKLVWMLSVSSYLKTEMLFLDETVNNLDVETVGKVAQMLDDFVKQREMKFYTITHNSEIQAMKIRNGILEVKNSTSEN